MDYILFDERNLYQQVKKNLAERNIEYLKRENTNMLNGITFTSGNEFFESLGMKFVETDRTYQTGDKKGQIVKVPDIKSKDDIPRTVTYYFDSCMDFLKKMVGEENIVVAQIHYDEDTPHLQAFFLPIVHEVKRKCFAKNQDGNAIKIETKNKNGKSTLIPQLLRDNNGQIIYENVKGNFLNNDQFWKDKGGKNSYAKMQDLFNKFVTERGFKLDRGNIGASVEHQDKLEWQINELKAEAEELQQEKEITIKEIKNNKVFLLKANENVDKNILNPIPNKVFGYNSKDVETLIDYSKNLEKVNIIQTNEIYSKDNLIFKLETENNSFKNNEEIKKRNTKIIEQDRIIKELNNKIDNLNLLVNTLTQTLDKWKKKLFKVIDKIFGKQLSNYENDYLKYADNFVKDKELKNKSNDFEI